MILYKEPHLQIVFKNVPCRHLLTVWNGKIKNDQFKHAITVILKCCMENEIRKILSDVRKQDQLSSEQDAFARALIEKDVISHGPFFQAVILASDVFVRFSSVDFCSDSYETDFVKKYFSNEKDALKWLALAG